MLILEGSSLFTETVFVVSFSNELKKVPFENNLQKIASNYLKVNEKNLSIRDIQLRMDFPNDSRNSYGWHQDNAYDEFNLNSKNGVILWIPLVDTNKDNGALVIKKGSQYSSFNCSKRISKGDDYQIFFTAPKSKKGIIRKISSNLSLKITKIGIIQKNSQKSSLVNHNNSVIKLKSKGYFHKF